MKLSIVFVVFLFCCSFAHASQPLSKNLIQKYIESTDQIEKIVEADPKLDKQLSDSMMMNKAQTIELVKSLKIYPQIKQVIKAAGFADFAQYYDIGYRIMGAMFKKQINSMPAGVNLDSYIRQMEEHLSSMKAGGMPESALKEMEASINEQLKSMAFMKKAASDALSDDAQFIVDNFEWMMKIMPMDEEEFSH